MRRLSHALLAALAFIAAGVAMTAPPAAASLKPEVLVKDGPAVTKTYPSLPNQGQGNESLNNPTPEECSKPPGDTYCDVIPVRVQLPSDYDDNSDEFITRVTLAWPTPSPNAVDMDLFIYNLNNVLTGKSANGAFDTNNPENNPKPDPNPEVSASADARFKVVVINSTGPNQGYTLKFAFTRKRFPPVTERPSSFGGGGFTPAAPTKPSASGPSGTRPSSSPFPSSFGPNEIALDLPPLDLTDPDFANGAGSDLNSGLFGGAAKSAAQTRPAKPVSAGILLAMLGALPLAAVASGGIFFRRRASRLLQF